MSTMDHDGFRGRLVATSSVLSLVGGSAEKARIYPLRLPQAGEFPALTYARISGRRDYHMTGASGVAEARLQVDCWAESYGAVKALADAVRLSLSGFRGTVNGVVLQSVFLDVERDAEEPALDAADFKLYRVSQDYMVRYEEATS